MPELLKGRLIVSRDENRGLVLVSVEGATPDAQQLVIYDVAMPIDDARQIVELIQQAISELERGLTSGA